MWNQVADSLSGYYEYDTIEDEYPNSEFIKADEILDPDGDLAPIQWFIEIQNQVIRRSQRLQEKTPTARLESQMLNETFNNAPVEQEPEDDDTITYTSGNNGKPLLMLIEKEFDLNKIIMKFYQQNKIYSKILENTKALRVSYGCHEISKSTSLDCNKICSDGVVRKVLWESLGDSHAIAIQWVHMVKTHQQLYYMYIVVANKYTTLMLLH